MKPPFKRHRFQPVWGEEPPKMLECCLGGIGSMQIAMPIRMKF